MNEEKTWFDKLTMFIYHAALIGVFGGIVWTILYYLILTISLFFGPMWLSAIVFFTILGIIFHRQIDEAIMEYEEEAERDLNENS